jgi:uncharacterized coiled-coil DUF342 family protein
LLADNEHLPKVTTETEGVRDILLAIDPEIQLLRDDISQLKKELFIKTTEKLIDRWEKDFSLTPDSSLTLQQRRARLLNKLGRKKTLNWQNLGILIRNNITKPQFYIMNDSANFFFRIMIQERDYTILENALKQAKPAYLTFDIVVTEYFRRTGTFVTGTEPI